MSIERFRHRTVLITGASSGIGECFARQLAPLQTRLVLLARRQDRLAALATELRGAGAAAAEPLAADLASADPADIAARAAQAVGPIDLLINNAGAGQYARFLDHTPGEIDGLIELNAVAPLRLARAVAPDMVARKNGWILNVASLAGLGPFPYMTIYAAAKAFLINASLGLRAELADAGVVVSCLMPGTTRSEFFNHPSFKYRRKEFMTWSVDPAIVAAAGLRGLSKNRPLIYTDHGLRLMALFQRHLPQAWLSRQLGRFMNPDRMSRHTPT